MSLVQIQPGGMPVPSATRVATDGTTVLGDGSSENPLRGGGASSLWAAGRGVHAIEQVNATSGVGRDGGDVAQNAANGENSLAVGQGNTTSGIASYAEGSGNTETVTSNVAGFGPECNHLEGNGNSIDVAFAGGGTNNHVEGWGNALTGTGSSVCDFNHVEGNGHQLSSTGPGVGSSIEFNHVEGNQNVLSATTESGALSFNHVEGNRSTLTCNGGDLEFCHIEGSGHTINASAEDSDFSHIEGDSHTVTNADTTHVEGYQSVVNVKGGTCNHVEGIQHTVGNGAHYIQAVHVEGANNTVTAAGDSAADTAHVEGAHNTASAATAHVQGDSALGSRETVDARASGKFAAAGDAQACGLVLRGSTPGAVPDETVELKFGANGNQQLLLEDGKAYAIKIKAAATKTGGASAASWEGDVFLAIQNAGAITINPAGPLVIPQTGAIGADPASWSLTVTIGAGPARIVITFETKTGAPVAARIVADVTWTEVAHA